LDGCYQKNKQKKNCQKITSVGEDVETVGRNVKWHKHFGKQYGSSSKN
jgi:hypothetical protein